MYSRRYRAGRAVLCQNMSVLLTTVFPPGERSLVFLLLRAAVCCISFHQRVCFFEAACSSFGALIGRRRLAYCRAHEPRITCVCATCYASICIALAVEHLLCASFPGSLFGLLVRVWIPSSLGLCVFLSLWILGWRICIKWCWKGLSSYICMFAARQSLHQPLI